MASSTEIPPVQNGFGTYIDVVARATAALLLIFYGTGFIILAAYDARYGIVQFGLLRTRILLTGFVFTALVVLSISTQFYRLLYFPGLKPVLENKEPLLQRCKTVVLKAGFVHPAFIIAVVLGQVLFVMPREPHPWWYGLVVIAAFVILLERSRYIGRNFSKNPGHSAFLSLFTAITFILILYRFGPRPIANLTVFILLAGLTADNLHELPSKFGYFLHPFNWYWVAFLLGFYISPVFGTIQAKWGGGAPTPVVLYLNATGPWLESSVANVSLVDETEQGLYVLISPKGKALFVPRSSVSSLYFGSEDELPKSSK